MAARRIESFGPTFKKISTARFLSVLLSSCAILSPLGCSGGGTGGGGDIRPSATVTTVISNKAALPDFTAGNPAILCSSYTIQGKCEGAAGEQINAYKWVLREYPEEARAFLKNLYGDTSPGGDEIIVEQGVVSPQNEINLTLVFEPQWPAPFDEAPRYSLGLAGSTTGGEEYSDIPLEGQWIFKTEPLRIDSVTHVSARDGGLVTINGAGFAGEVVLQVGGSYGPVTLTPVDCGTIEFTMPAGDYCGIDTIAIYNSGDRPHFALGTLIYDPVINGIPDHISARDGGLVTIDGHGFGPSVVVQAGVFGPLPLASVDCNTIQFTMPAGNYCGSDTITVYNSDDESSHTTTGTLTYDPVILGIPDHVPARDGGPVTILGSGFDTSVVLQVGGSYGPVTLTPVDCNTIQFTMPVGSYCVSDPVTVYNVADSSHTTTGTLIYDPVILSVSRASCQGESVVTINGYGFNDSVPWDESVLFQATLEPDPPLNITSRITSLTCTDMTFTAPAGTQYRDLLLAMVNLADLAHPAYADLQHDVQITGVSRVPSCNGGTVVVDGCGFNNSGPPYEVVIEVDGAGRTITSVTPTQIQFTEPGGGCFNATVASYNSAEPAVTGSGTLAYDPCVNGITLDEGPEAGGTDTLIDGTCFKNGATTYFGGSQVSGATVDSLTQISATSPPGVGTVNITVTNTDAGTDTLSSGFEYKDRNVSGGYTEASLSGNYNSLSITHGFAGPGDASDDMYATFVGSDFNPVFAPINGGTTTFAGDGTYAVSAGANDFSVTNDGTPSTSLIDAAADSGTYAMADSGTLTMEGHRTGSLAPDANALFVTTTLSQIDTANAMYIYAREGSGSTPVSLDGKTMGFVAFVHEYEAAQASVAVYSFQGEMSFSGGDFTLTALSQIRNLDQGGSVTTATSTGDHSGGAYDADTSGLFRLSFEVEDSASEPDLFDSDEVIGIFTVTDDPIYPEDAQLFAGVNLSSNGTSPGRSLLLIMMPLGSGKDASSFGGELADMGWTQGLFGHEFDVLAADESTYATSDAEISYSDASGDQTEVAIKKRVVTDSSQTPSSGPGLVNVYSVQSNGQYTASGPSPAIEGFISEDDSVNASVDTANTQTNNIRLELTK